MTECLAQIEFHWVPSSKLMASRKIFWRGGPATHALDAADLNVAAGEFLCVLGPSGCGKSTFLRVLAGSITPEVAQAYFRAGQWLKQTGKLDDAPSMRTIATHVDPSCRKMALNGGFR